MAGARARYICVTSVHGVMTARDDREVGNPNGADIVTPDGMPLVWALRSLGLSQQRVYGPQLMLRLCEAAARHNYKIYLYGATGRMSGRAAATAARALSGLAHCGMVLSSLPAF